MIIPSHKCLFIHINRTGGTTVESIFGKPTWDHRTLREYLKDDQFLQSYFKFAVVRNPCEKEVSDWFHHKKVKGVDISFEEYFNQPEFDRNHPSFKYHSNQIEWLFDNNNFYGVDYVIRFERFEEDLNKLLWVMGFGKKEIPKINSTDHLHYREYYTTDLSNRVFKNYTEDIIQFGYSF
jgi:chondroitin 4-sulfotransferase 11